MTAIRMTGGPLPPLRALRYLALGDSYTIGEGVGPAGRWPVQLAHALRAEGVMLGDPKIVAATGWTTDELAAALDAFDASHTAVHVPVGAASAAGCSDSAEDQGLAAEAAPTTAEPPRWDFVSLLIGVNDQYRGRGLDAYRAGFAGLLARAIDYARGRADRVLVLSIPDWGVTPFASREGRDGAQVARELDACNASAREACDRHGVAFVDVTAASRELGAAPGMLADDGLHPSAAMYAAWVRLVLPVARGLLA
ncbi:SGNH/GDSL hydrolase family protein [Luteimonas notoginsengisoli]|uniref:SGNH/GDSL hydrolase family protein n=1 Tax=Luteimonas notoginsengisoli TaxID=1578200 RepID=A0ABV7UUP0_9GAMM